MTSVKPDSEYYFYLSLLPNFIDNYWQMMAIPVKPTPNTQQAAIQVQQRATTVPHRTRGSTSQGSRERMCITVVAGSVMPVNVQEGIQLPGAGSGIPSGGFARLADS